MDDRIFFAAGPGNVIHAHEQWSANRHDPTQTSITYSSQFEEFCRNIGASAYIISYNEGRKKISDGPFILEHRPKPFAGAAGLSFHIREALYALGLLRTAVEFGANIAVIDSGTSQYFMLFLFRLAGIKVVLHLHNTLWPRGFPPTRRAQRLISYLDSLFFRYGAAAIIGVSPECVRQVKRLTKGRHGPVYETRAQYRREHFVRIEPPPRDQRPFRIMFVGRITRDKGVFDVLEMARKIEAGRPRRVQWEICGAGPDLDELKQQHSMMGLQEVVNIRGWTAPNEICQLFPKVHASIVPTRSGFAEGLPLTSIESVLASRPVITSAVNPAIEVFEPTCVEARTDDVGSYVEAILKLIDNPDDYQRLRDNCAELQEQFYDRQRGFAAVLKEVIMPSSNRP
ncbi:MAG: glycosyltransferase family 4 protein [Methylovirgula sp.]